MVDKMEEYIKHIVIWSIVCFICSIFAERYASYLNIGMGLGLGIICMGIAIKTVNPCNISSKVKRIVEISVIYSVGICIILLLWMWQVRNGFVNYNDLLDIISITYLLEIIFLSGYILVRKIFLKQVVNKYLLIVLGIFVICVYMYINEIVTIDVILILSSIVISVIFYVFILKECIDEFVEYYDYFLCFIVSRMIESIYLIISNAKESTIVFLLLFRFIQIYYLLRCTICDIPGRSICKEYDKLDFFNREITKQNKVSYIIANLSHELKTPINVIISALEIINLEEKIDTRVREEIQVIKKECAAIMDMVQMIVDIQKTHDDKDNRNTKKYNIVELVENISDAFNYEYGKGKIIFDTYEEEVCMCVNKSLAQQAIMGILHTMIYMDPDCDINICITNKCQYELEISIAQSQTTYIRKIIDNIARKIPVDNKKDNIIHILSVQVLLEVTKAYGGSVTFKECNNYEAMVLAMPVAKSDSEEISVISEWNIDELRENIKIKYMS